MKNEALFAVHDLRGGFYFSTECFNYSLVAQAYSQQRLLPREVKDCFFAYSKIVRVIYGAGAR